MTDYTSKICVACSADAQPASTNEVNDFLKEYLEWHLATDVSFPQLRREYRFKNFTDAQMFTNLIGDLAEAEGHHPSLLLEYGKVTVRWWSHKIESLHINDFILSSKTEEIYKSNLRSR